MTTFIDRLLDVSSFTVNAAKVPMRHGDTPRSLVEAELNKGTRLLVVFAEDAAGADWMIRREVADALRGSARKFDAAIVCATPLAVRVNNKLDRMSPGLAGVAAVRLRIEPEDELTFRISVEKNTVAAPFGEATIS